MDLLCPECLQPLNGLVCPNRHGYEMVDGVLVLLEAAFARRLQAFNAALEQFRSAEGKRLLDSAIYEDLPHAAAVRGEFEWRLRGYDLAVICRLIRRRRQQRILDIGAWNGWLSHRLAALGHDVTAIDYFTDRFDGLGARQFYSTAWQAIQMDLTDLSPLNRRFDVVVLNRCLQFFGDPAQYVALVSQKLAPGGLLIAAGLSFFQDPGARARQMYALQRRFRRQYGMEFFLHPTKGYLDFDDKARLETSGVELHPYWQLIPANLKSMIGHTLPRYYYGVYTANPGT